MGGRDGALLRALFTCALLLCVGVLAFPVGILTVSVRGAASVEERDERAEEHASTETPTVSSSLHSTTRRVLVTARGRRLPYARPRALVPHHLEAPVRHDTKRLPLRC